MFDRENFPSPQLTVTGDRMVQKKITIPCRFLSEPLTLELPFPEPGYVAVLVYIGRNQHGFSMPESDILRVMTALLDTDYDPADSLADTLENKLISIIKQPFGTTIIDDADFATNVTYYYIVYHELAKILGKPNFNMVTMSLNTEEIVQKAINAGIRIVKSEFSN